MATNIPTVEEFNEELPVSSWDRNTVADGNWLQANTIGPLKNRDDKIIELLQDIEVAGNSWKNWSEDNGTYLEGDNNYYIGSGNSALGDTIVIGNNNKVKNSTVYGNNNDISATNSTNDIRVVTGMKKDYWGQYSQVYETITDVPTQGLVVGSDNYSDTFNPIIIGTHNSASIDGSFVATIKERWNKDGVMTPNYPIAIGIANKSYRNFDTSIGTNNIADGGFNFIYGVNNSAYGTQNVILNTNGTFIYGHQNYAYGPNSQLITLSGDVDTAIDDLVPDRRCVYYRTKNVLYNAAVTTVERYGGDTMVIDSIFKDCNVWIDQYTTYGSNIFTRNEFNKCYFVCSGTKKTSDYKLINVNKIEGGGIKVNAEDLWCMCHNNLRFGSVNFSKKPWNKPAAGGGYYDGMSVDINAEFFNFNNIYLENESHGFGLSGVYIYDYNKVYNSVTGNYISIGYSGAETHGGAFVDENLIYQSIFDIKYDKAKHSFPWGAQNQKQHFSHNILFDSVYVVDDEDLQSYTIDTNGTYWSNNSYNSNVLINTNIYNSHEIVSIASKKALSDFISMDFNFYENKDGDEFIGFDTEEEADTVLAAINTILAPYTNMSNITWGSLYKNKIYGKNTWIVTLQSFSYYTEDPGVKTQGEALENSFMTAAPYVKRSGIRREKRNSVNNVKAGIKNSESVVSIGTDNELSATVSTHIFGFNNNLTGAENSVIIGNHNYEFITPMSYAGKTIEEASEISGNRPALYDTVILGSNNTVSSNAVSGETDYENLNTIARNVYIGFNNDILINKLVTDNYVIGNNNDVLDGKNLYRNKIIGLDNTINSNFSDCNVIGGHNQLVNNTEGIFENNTILGMYNLVKFGSNSTLIGHHNIADGYNGVAIGEGLSATNSQVVIGRFNEALPGTDDRDGFDVTAGALFIVGNGHHDDTNNDFANPTRSNAMVVSADGTVSARTYKADPDTPLGKLFDFLTTATLGNGSLTWNGTTWSIS